MRSRDTLPFPLLASVDPIIERARALAGVPTPETPPKLFNDDLLLDMQNVLLAMERRVKDGPNSLSVSEVTDMEAAIERIVAEMKVNQNKKPDRIPAMQSPPGSLLHAEPDVIQALPKLLQTRPIDSNVADMSEDEGPSFDGRGGMGQPKGTINTYVIPGMDEMSAEEYQQTLQQSIIDRQARRRASGTVGNLSSTSYLDSL